MVHQSGHCGSPILLHRGEDLAKVRRDPLSGRRFGRFLTPQRINRPKRLAVGGSTAFSRYSAGALGVRVPYPWRRTERPLWRKPAEFEGRADVPQKEQIGPTVVVAQEARPSGRHGQLDRIRRHGPVSRHQQNAEMVGQPGRRWRGDSNSYRAPPSGQEEAAAAPGLVG